MVSSGRLAREPQRLHSTSNHPYPHGFLRCTALSAKRADLMRGAKVPRWQSAACRYVMPVPIAKYGPATAPANAPIVPIGHNERSRRVVTVIIGVITVIKGK
jgi:hypothetical protein